MSTSQSIVSISKKRARSLSITDDSDVPSKRALLQEEDNCVPLAKSTPSGYKRDKDYYMEDGSCVILVQDTLFNVHKSILSKDTSTFSAMFSLPQGKANTEGRSDENPIILSGDTVTEFRNFLWALYALPPEIMSITSSTTKLIQLIDVAQTANKYSFKTMETWALDAIQDFIERKPLPIFAMMPQIPLPTSPQDPPTSMSLQAAEAIPKEYLRRLFRLAKLCDHQRLLNSMVNLLKQLMVSSISYTFLAMEIADEFDLDMLRGIAYLEVMHKAAFVKNARVEISSKSNQIVVQRGFSEPLVTRTELADSSSSSSTHLSAKQQLRLLAGYYRLTDTWERLRTVPPHFDHAPACGATWHQSGCTQSWLEFWKENTRIDSVLSRGAADVLGRLRQVHKEFDRWGSATFMHHDCRLAARKSLQEIIKRVEDALPEFFSDA